MEFRDAVSGCYEEVMELEDMLCRIPSPSWKEQKRAAFIREWLSGYDETTVDEADNVIFCRFDDGSDGAVLVCAHTDTVFPDLEPFEPVTEGGKYFCPGAGDDTLNLAIMMVLVNYPDINDRASCFTGSDLTAETTVSSLPQRV